MTYSRCIGLTLAILMCSVGVTHAGQVTEERVLTPNSSVLQFPEVDGIVATFSVPVSDSLVPTRFVVGAGREAPIDAAESPAVTQLSDALPPGTVPLAWYELRSDETITYDSLGTLTLRVRLSPHDVVRGQTFYALACDATNCRVVKIPLERRGRVLQPPERFASIHFRFATWAAHTYIMAICEQSQGEGS